MRTLVIGYGNPLRGDDAVGWHVVEGLAARHLDDLEVRCVHQLTPELAADLADVDLAVFVDADPTISEVTLRPVQASTAAAVSSHHQRPENLLGLAEALDGGPGRAVVVAVPAAAFPLTTALSQACARHVTAAVRAVLALKRTTQEPDDRR